MARKILLADDSVTAQNMGRKILSEAGFEVITVSNGSAALKKAVEQRPDLIVLDVYMPGYSGLEVCQRLKEMRETARMPVLLTVGKLEPFKPDEARRARADAFIIKPFEASELLAAVRKLEDRVIAGPEPSKPGRLAKLLSRNAPVEAPDKDAGIEEDGWKERLSIPARPRVSEAETEVTAPAEMQMASSPVVQPTVEERPEAHASDPLADITPEEIAAIKAAAATLTGALDKQPGKDYSQDPAVVASEPEFPVEAEKKAASAIEPEAVRDAVSSGSELPAAEGFQVSQAAACTSDAGDAVLQSSAPQKTSAEIPGPRWVAQEVPLEGGEGDASLAGEMQVFLAMATEQSRHAATPAGSNGNVTLETTAAEDRHEGPIPVAAAGVEKLDSPSQEAQAAAPRQDEHVDAEAEILDDHAEPPSTFAVAVMTETVDESSSIPAAPSAMLAELAHPSTGTPSENTQTPAVSTAEVAGESAMAMAASASANAPASPVETELVPSAVGATTASDSADMQGAVSPSASVIQGPIVETTPSPQDKIHAAEMAAAWSHWQEIRQSIVGSGLADQITDVAAAAARASETNSQSSTASSAGSPEPSPVASEQSAPQPGASANPDPSAIASIVDSVLAELKPKLVEEIAKKLGEKK